MTSHGAWLSAGGLVAVLAAGSVLAACRDAERRSKPSATGQVASSAPSKVRTRDVPAPARPWLHGRTATPAPRADARSVIARIQSNLERVAAGLPPGPRIEPPADALELLVEAYRAFLAGDATADALVEKVDSLARARLVARADILEKENDWHGADSPTAYVQALDRAKTAPGSGAKGAALRLAVAFRRTDAALVLEATRYGLFEDLLFTRNQALFTGLENLPLAGVWLKFPCRTLRGRRAAFEFAAKRLGKTAGVLFGCPAPHGRELDFTLFERMLDDETRSAVVRRPSTPSEKTRRSTSETPRGASRRDVPRPPWTRWVAGEFMAHDADAAERALCAPEGALGKLDCALFLHAFRPPSAARDERIRRLIAEVDAASRTHEESAAVGAFTPRPYDGSDASLVPSVQLASSTGSANTHSAFYAIPCAVLERRPALLAATESAFGGNLDNFLPRSGCRGDRGFVEGFPEQALEAYRALSDEADGDYIDNFSGTMRYGLTTSQHYAIERLKLDPRTALAGPAAPRMKPYETWSLLSAKNRATYERLGALADTLRSELSRYYEKKGLLAEEAGAVSEHVLFASVWGASCGGAAPEPTLRGLLSERASLNALRVFVAAGEHLKAERFAVLARCAESAGMDPLLHQAVTYPDALPLVWELGRRLPGAEAEALDLVMEPNLPNAFGKTPLMVAAQFAQEASVRFLLEQGADPNARTWNHGDPALGHDARTALMYAAGSGSLATIRLLLRAGADVHAADTKAATALDYLVGAGPVPANPELSATEFREAARLLF